MNNKKHKNRKAYNWLMYDIGDKWRNEYSIYYKGDLYDLGCADAYYKDFFLKYCNSYTGVDWSNTIHNNNADIVTDLNKEFKIKNDVADTIISLSVMEHLYNPQLFLKESYRILKKDSYIILGVPWMWHIHEAPHDYFRYTPYGLKYLFSEAGFKEIHIQPTSGFFTMISMKINYFTLKFISGSSLKMKITEYLLFPLWYTIQKLAPILDNLHRGWSSNTVGFYVVAKK